MKEKEARGNAKIKQAYANAVPDIRDAILSDCGKENGKMAMMTEEKKKKGFVKYMLAAAGLLVLAGAGTLMLNMYQVNYAVASTVSLEVNPGIQITVNKKERVLDVKALNKDGGIVIGDMDFSGSDIDVTVNALIGSMLRKGYLNELANSILISVDNTDLEKGAVLQKRLTEEVNELLESDGFFGAVLGQTIIGDDALQQQAEQYDITLGKAQLIQQILDSTEGHTFDELAPLSINELNLLITSGAPEIEKVSSLGNASDKAYIGEEKAKETAFAHAGISEQDIYFYEMDMDVEKGVMVYEIEFKCGGYEYEYDINAQTGEVIKNKKEIDDDMPVSGADNAVPAEQQGMESTPSAQQQEAVDIPSAGQQGTENNSAPATPSGTYPYTGMQHHPEPHHRDYHHGGYSGQGYAVQTPPAATPDAQQGNTTALITVEQAKEIALNHAGLAASAVYFEKAELDYDDGMQIYEIEFISGNMEYEYEINAQSGDIWDYEWDYD